MEVTGSFVCRKCLEENPTRVDLISNKCLLLDQHASEPRVSVVWRPERGLERVRRDNTKPVMVVRPMPKVHFRGPFVLCDGVRCKGERCTFAHSNEERDEWNRKRFSGINYLRSSPTTKETLPPASSPPATLSPLSKLATYADSVKRNQIPQGPLSPPSTSSHFPAPATQVVEAAESFCSDKEQLPWPDYTEMGHKAAQSSCEPPQFHFGTSPHMQEVTTPAQVSLPNLGLLPTPVTHDASRICHQMVAPPQPTKQALLMPRPQATRLPACMQANLGRDNYRRKFRTLLRSEENAHAQILNDKCNGHYNLVLHQAGLSSPTWMRFEADPLHKRYGYVFGLNGDQIAYATQASGGAVIMCNGDEIRASILRENFNQVEERMYIAFDANSVQKLEKYLHVKNAHCKRNIALQFELKHSYFRSLCKSVEELPREAIEKIVPSKSDFQDVQLQKIPKRYKSILKLDNCSNDQVQALEAIISCPSNGPPVLVSGPFGTGKTRILATAAHYFIQKGRDIGQPVRVLVCTQQHVSADTFLEHYLDLMTPKERDLNILRLTPRSGNRNPKYKRWYKTVERFKRDFERSSQSNESSFLIITTCQTALRVANVFIRGFFTHILLDEGAQMREPEGIAPLCLATKNTKIVIAGDEHQVGPAMLVLGEEARRNGLAKSLLERLHRLYQEFGDAANHYSTTLVTNYRCHQKILTLAERLFYDQRPLKCNVPDMSAHPDAPYPLLFVCSSIDDTVQQIESNINESEARIVLEQVAKYADNWPVHGWGKKDLSQTCIISPSRSQLTVASRLLNRMRLPSKLKEVRRYPTYDIQGREFRAIFLSTSEPTEKDGATCNPTKSICDRYIFNTAVTRAQSLVVSVGNPFILLRAEQHMVERYGNKGKCWSTYLQFCLQHNTLSIDPSLRVSSTEKERIVCGLRECVQKRLSTNVIKVPPQEDEEPSSTQTTAAIPHSSGADDKRLEVPSQSYTPPPKPKITPLNEGSHDIGTDNHNTEEVLEKEYKLQEELGRGGFGVVYHVTKKFDSVDYALKIIKLPTQKRQQEKVMREVRALANLDHPRIVRYFTSWAGKAPSNLKVLAALKSSESIACAEGSTYTNMATEDSSAPTTPSSAHTPSQSTDTSVGEGLAESSTTDSVVEFCNDRSQRTPPTAAVVPTSPSRPDRPTCLFIQIQLCRKDTLREWLRNNTKNRPRKDVMSFFDQILDAVVYIHKEGMFHRDLKPSNIFFSLKDGSVKVGDFGLVTGHFTTEHFGEERVQKSHSSQAGTLLYMAPEQLCGKKYNEKVDIFSLGVIFFELNCLFITDMERFKILTDVRNRKLPPQFIDKLPQEAELIKWLLSPEPSKRPSAEDLAKSNQLRRLKTSVKRSRMDYVPKLL